jgi:DNA-binding MarR family transcriptional regulator
MSRPSRRFPDAPDFVGRLLREAFAQLIAEMNEALQAEWPESTPATARVMTMLDREGVRVVDLAARLQLTKQSASELVATLERSGLVERRPDPTDGRAKLVVPTAEGERAMRVGFDIAQRVHRRWTDLVGEEEMATLMRSLGVLVEALRES